MCRPLNIPDPLSRFNSGHTEKVSKSEAGGLKRLPLLLFGLGSVLCVLIAGPFLANGVMFPADGFARPVEEFLGSWFHRGFLRS